MKTKSKMFLRLLSACLSLALLSQTFSAVAESNPAAQPIIGSVLTAATAEDSFNKYQDLNFEEYSAEGIQFNESGEAGYSTSIGGSIGEQSATLRLQFLSNTNEIGSRLYNSEISGKKESFSSKASDTGNFMNSVYGLGIGWSLPFPQIEYVTDRVAYYHMGNGKAYRIVKSEEDDTYNLSGYPYSFTITKRTNTVNDAQVFSGYTATDKYGNEYLFDENGRFTSQIGGEDALPTVSYGADRVISAIHADGYTLQFIGTTDSEGNPCRQIKMTAQTTNEDGTTETKETVLANVYVAGNKLVKIKENTTAAEISEFEKPQYANIKKTETTASDSCISFEYAEIKNLLLKNSLSEQPTELDGRDTLQISKITETENTSTVYSFSLKDGSQESSVDVTALNSAAKPYTCHTTTTTDITYGKGYTDYGTQSQIRYNRILNTANHTTSTTNDGYDPSCNFDEESQNTGGENSAEPNQNSEDTEESSTSETEFTYGENEKLSVVKSTADGTTTTTRYSYDVDREIAAKVTDKVGETLSTLHTVSTTNADDSAGDNPTDITDETDNPDGEENGDSSGIDTDTEGDTDTDGETDTEGETEPDYGDNEDNPYGGDPADTDGELTESNTQDVSVTGRNAKGEVVYLKNADGECCYKYNSGGSVVKEVPENGLITTYVYDLSGNKIKVTESDGTLSRTTRYFYDDRNRIIRVINARQYDEACDGLNPDDDCVCSENIYLNSNIGERYTYDNNGNALTYINSANNKTVNTYDSENRLVKSVTYENASTAENGLTTRYIYDADGNLVKTVYPHQYNAENDNLDLQNGVNEYTDSTVGERVTYDENGNVATHTDSFGKETVNTYDGQGHIVKSVSGNEITRYVYNGGDNLLQVIYPDQYNPDDDNLNLSAETPTDTYADSNIGDRYTYDDNGNVLTYTNRFGKVTTNTYDSNGNLSETAKSGGNVFAFNNDGKATKETYSVGLVRDYTYTLNKTEVTDSNGTTASYLTNAFGEVTEYKLENGTNSKKYSYTYDAGGNIISISLNGSLQQSFTYNASNEIVRVDDAVANKSVTYDYDFVGNITSVKTYIYTTGTLGTPITTQNYTYNSQNRRTDLSYDESGNIAELGDYALGWSGRRLTSATSENRSISYTYNSGGIRTSKTVNGITTYYEVDENDNVVKQYELANGAETNILEFVYDSNNSPVYFTYNDTAYYYEKNLQGDIVSILDKSGNAVVKYVYNSWGKVTSVTNGAGAEISKTDSANIANLNPMRYRGYYYDAETELYYLQSRYYSPEQMRFISQDDPFYSNLQAAPLGCNLYAYCMCNPVVNIDPYGYGTTYVFYYNKKSSGFKDQAMNSPYYNKNNKNVVIIAVRSIADFKKAWKGMSGTVDYIYLYLHGGTGVLYFDGETMNMSQIKKLSSKTVKYRVYLFSCHGGNGKEGNNVAWAIAKLTNTRVIAFTGSVSYSKFFGKYYARKAWDWGIIKTFYYQKQYVYWGKVVAKSGEGQW